MPFIFQKFFFLKIENFYKYEIFLLIIFQFLLLEELGKNSKINMKGTLHFLLQTKNTIIKPNLLPRIDNILRVVVRGVVEVVVLE